MSVRIGNPQQVNLAATALGAAGASIALSNSGWALFVSAMAIYVSTATQGNRQLVFDFKDALGNLIWRTKSPALIIAQKTAYLALASRIAGDAIELRTLQQIVASGLNVLDELDPIRSDVDANPAPMLLTMALPEGFSIPVNSVLVVTDANAVDVNDTVQATVIYTL